MYNTQKECFIPIAQSLSISKKKKHPAQYPTHTQPHQTQESKHTRIYASLLFPARLRFHLPRSPCRFDHFSYVLFWLLFVFIKRIRWIGIFSHGTGSLSFVLFSHVRLLFHSGFYSAEKVVQASVWVFTHAFTRHDIELAASIYSIPFFFFPSFHFCRHFHISLLNDSIRLIFMCFALCCFWLYNCLLLLLYAFYLSWKRLLFLHMFVVVMMMHANLFVDFLVGILYDFRYGWCTIDCAVETRNSLPLSSFN